MADEIHGELNTDQRLLMELRKEKPAEDKWLCFP